MSSLVVPVLLLAGGAVLLTLTVGLAALLAPLPAGRRVLQYGLASAAAGAVAVVLLWNGVLGRVEGAALVLLYAAGVGWVWRREKAPPAIGELAELEEDDDSAVPSGRALLLVGAGLAGMLAGGYLAVRGAEGLVQRHGVARRRGPGASGRARPRLAGAVGRGGDRGPAAGAAPRPAVRPPATAARRRPRGRVRRDRRVVVALLIATGTALRPPAQRLTARSRVAVSATGSSATSNTATAA